MGRKRIFMIALFLFFCLVIIGIGATYSYFYDSKTSNEQEFQIGELEFEVTSESGTIDLVESYPIPDSTGVTSNPYVFTVENTNDSPATYIITLVKDTETATTCGCSKELDFSALKYTLNDSNPEFISSNDTILSSGGIDAGQVKTFSLRLWIDENSGNEIIGAHFHGKIMVSFRNYDGSEIVQD